MEPNKNLEKYLKDLSNRDFSEAQIDALSSESKSRVYKNIVQRKRSFLGFSALFPRLLLTFAVVIFGILVLSPEGLVYNVQNEGIKGNVMVLDNQLDDLNVLNSRLESMEYEVQELLSLY